ncbi:MAG: FecR family protein [Runella sp.]
MNLQPNWELLAAYLANETSADQKQLVEQWLSESPENEILIKNLTKIWQTKQPPINQSFDSDKAFEKIHLQLKEEVEESASIRPLHTMPRVLWWAAAASVVLLLGIFGYWRMQQDATTEWLTKTTTQHEKVLITLADQTKVWLNQNSILRYPKVFEGDTRSVSLTGEAFFEVAKNPNKPFIISSEQVQVKVLGTAFNLRTDVQQQLFETIVVEGKVAFAVASKGEVILTANQAGKVDKNDTRIVTSFVNPDEFMGWRTGKLVFRDTDMTKVISELENWYKVKIEVQNPTIFKKRLTGTFDNIALKRALDRLSELLSVKYEQKSEEVFVIK